MFLQGSLSEAWEACMYLSSGHEWHTRNLFLYILRVLYFDFPFLMVLAVCTSNFTVIKNGELETPLVRS